jgi:hypothetical protein
MEDLDGYTVILIRKGTVLRIGEDIDGRLGMPESYRVAA